MYKTNGNIAMSREAAYEAFRKPKVIGKSSAHLGDEKHLLTTCYTYWEDFIMKDNSFDTICLPNGEPATEITFSMPYFEDEHIIVRLCGTIDTIGKIKNGVYCIRDFKTTSKFKVNEYLSEYKMSKQLRFYTLALKLMAEHEPDSMLGRIGATPIGTRIDAIFLKPKASENEYHSSDVFIFKDDTIAEFRAVLNSLIRKLSYHISSNYFPREGIVNATCKSEYKCKFYNVCGAPAEMQDTLLNRDFKVVHYNPLKFNEV